VKLLDLGGTFNYWKQMGMAGKEELEITLLNTEPQQTEGNIKFILQDAENLSNFKDREFDVVYSNSLIEHITMSQKQHKIASEIKRISKAYFIQTPNYYFPFEPHFLFPCFQFLPHGLKIWLVKHLPLGWFPKAKTNHEASEIIKSVRLLKPKEFSAFFPDAKIFKEKICFLSKSLTAMKAYTYSQNK
jgi:ubiquinone/menaquinone biosynthesis C-methylase UbiE